MTSDLDDRAKAVNAQRNNMNATARRVTVQQELAGLADRMLELDRGGLLKMIVSRTEWAEITDLTQYDCLLIAAAATRMAEIDAENQAR